ncbi:MAG: transposase [Uliginosibacterium sp.]|nr:transposase [Uliginosibacterium sp.]
MRVVEYALPGADGQSVRYRLMSSLLDPDQAPAVELAALYHTRWQVEAVFDELKTHLQQRRRVLRSKTPELVRQEFYGWVLAHYAVRWLMHQVASEYRLSHAQLSFTAHVQLMRRAQPLSGAFPPERPRKRRRWFRELLQGRRNCGQCGPWDNARPDRSNDETPLTLRMTITTRDIAPSMPHPNSWGLCHCRCRGARQKQSNRTVLRPDKHLTRGPVSVAYRKCAST